MDQKGFELVLSLFLLLPHYWGHRHTPPHSAKKEAFYFIGLEARKSEIRQPYLSSLWCGLEGGCYHGGGRGMQKRLDGEASGVLKMRIVLLQP